MTSKNNTQDYKDLPAKENLKQIMLAPATYFAVAVLALGGYGVVKGGEEVAKFYKKNSWSDFNPDAQARLIDKGRPSSSGGGIGLAITGLPSAPVIAKRDGDNTAEKKDGGIFILGQDVENPYGDKAEAVARTYVDEETYGNYKKGQELVPSELQSHIEEIEAWRNDLKDQ